MMRLSTSAIAICPGCNYGIANMDTETCLTHLVGFLPLLKSNQTGKVFDDSYNAVYEVISSNPCTVGVFDCSPAPVMFTGLNYNGNR